MIAIQFSPMTLRAAFLDAALSAFCEEIATQMTTAGPTVDNDGWLDQEALQDTASALVLLRGSDFKSAKGVTHALYTCHDTTSPAFRASFDVPVPELTPETLRTAHALCVAKFTAASLKTAPQSVL